MLNGELRRWNLYSYIAVDWFGMLGVALTLILLLVRILGFGFSSEVVRSRFISQSFNNSA